MDTLLRRGKGRRGELEEDENPHYAPLQREGQSTQSYGSLNSLEIGQLEGLRDSRQYVSIAGKQVRITAEGPLPVQVYRYTSFLDS